MNEAMKRLMAQAEDRPRAARGERPTPTRQYNTRMNEDTRQALLSMSHELKTEGHPGYEYQVIDALLLALEHRPHREYVRHLLGLRGPLSPDEAARLP